MLPGAAPIRRLNWFTLFLLAAIVAASLSIYRGWATERDLHLARIDGHNIVQFNPVDPLASFDSRWWTAEDLAELQTLPVIADLAWDGTEHRTIAVGRSALVRTGVSPGYLSFFRTAFPADGISTQPTPTCRGPSSANSWPASFSRICISATSSGKR